jgi:hypothetical protein
MPSSVVSVVAAVHLEPEGVVSWGELSTAMPELSIEGLETGSGRLRDSVRMKRRSRPARSVVGVPGVRQTAKAADFISPVQTRK